MALGGWLKVPLAIAFAQGLWDLGFKVEMLPLVLTALSRDSSSPILVPIKDC